MKQREINEQILTTNNLKDTLDTAVDTTLTCLLPSRERSLVITKLEEATMWLDKFIKYMDNINFNKDTNEDKN